MMSYFFLTSTASVWIAILYMFLGLPLLLNPVASGTFFIWALAAGSAVYAVQPSGALYPGTQGRPGKRRRPVPDRRSLLFTVLP